MMKYSSTTITYNMCIDASKCKQWNRQYLKRCWINFHTERSIDDGMSILETRKSMDSVVYSLTSARGIIL